jgi:crotonobetainyl-CoA:carnitine CoA-transferase CaiB-like acyl-CoA transferase
MDKSAQEENMANRSFEKVMDIRGLGMPDAGEATILGQDPVYSTKFRIGDTCACVLAGIGVGINDIWEMKTGRRQQVSVDVRNISAGLNSSRFMQRPDKNGKFKTIVSDRHEAMLRVTQPWPTRDGRWFLPHFGLPNLAERALKVLACTQDPDSVKVAVARRAAMELEDAFDEIGGCGAMVRSHEEWLAHPHGQALAAKPIFEIDKIGDSEPEPFPESARPLDGIRALDLTRILAGPVAARTLAEHGADVLMVTAADLPQIPEHVLDTSHGKRSCFLDLRTESGKARLRELAKGADVFAQGYRPGVMEKYGFAPEQLAELRPGIVSLSISCFGAGGPFSHRAGWEQIAQTVTGICHEGAQDRPALLPAAACDYTTGYLGAYGVLLALARRAREGGSYHVHVSLCQSGMFIYRQGNVDFDATHTGPTEGDLQAIRVESQPASGPLRHLGPILRMSETQPRWSRPTPTLGGDKPAWLPAHASAQAAE